MENDTTKSLMKNLEYFKYKRNVVEVFRNCIEYVALRVAKHVDIELDKDLIEKFDNVFVNYNVLRNVFTPFRNNCPLCTIIEWTQQTMPQIVRPCQPIPVVSNIPQLASNFIELKSKDVRPKIAILKKIHLQLPIFF